MGVDQKVSGVARNAATPSLMRLLANRSLQYRAAAMFVASALVVIAIPFVKIVRSPRGDFPRHVEFGERLLAGSCIYDKGLNLPYPPLWALVHAPFSMIPIEIAQPLVFPIGVIALALLIATLNSLTSQIALLRANVLFWVWAAALLISSRFLVRDFDECGPNLALLALGWMSIWLWTRDRDFLAGIPLGLAIALKCTSGLLLVYFAYKRQWRFAAATVVAAAAFTIAPVFVQGPTNYVRDMAFWAKTLSGGLAASSPIVGVLGDEPLINKSLRSTLGRYAMHLPPGHAGRVDHPAYLDLLDLTPRSASMLVLIATLSIVAVFAWLFRQPIGQRRDAEIIWQCAAVSALSLLLSPVTWSQHCVATIPAVFLVVRQIASGRGMPTWAWIASAVYILLVAVFNRGMFGRDLGLALDSYRPATWAIVLLLIVATTIRATSDDARNVESRSMPRVAA